MKISFVGKAFLAASAAWATKKWFDGSLDYSPEEVQRRKHILAHTIFYSQRFQWELQQPGATTHSVMRKLGLNSCTPQHFEYVLGIKWPLD